MIKTIFRFVFFCLVVLSPGFATTHIITNSGFTFFPDSLVITAGDTIQFNLAAIHNAIEVNQTTYDTNGNTSNGGFSVPFGGGPLILTAIGKHYFVCHVHASMGMKGIIVVNPASPGSVLIQSVVDQDGHLATDGDRAFKNWNLSLYKNSVVPANLVQSTESSASLPAGGLTPGTYIAVEADSLQWSHLSVNVDGVSQGAVNANQWTIVLNAGESHTITFLNYAPYVIRDSEFTFIPESLVVPPGTTVHFVLDPMHVPREVSATTWIANDTLSNGGFDLPGGGGSALLSTPGTHYYVCVPHASIGMKGKIVVASSSAPTTVVVSLVGGWDLVSVPVEVTDPQTSTLFPTATSHAFAYQGSYVPVTVLSNGPGYWLKFDVDHSDSISGFPITADSIDVLKGWNMIGSLSQPLPTSAISSSPGGIINSQFFGYNGGYFSADTIVPGFGYWVNATEQGKLLLTSSFTHSALHNGNNIDEFQMGQRLIVGDAAGHQRTLSIIDDVAGMVPKRFDQLPPLPPEGGFDVRFASGVQVQRVAENSTAELPILVSSDAYPLTVRWETGQPGRRAFLKIDGNSIGLGTSSLRIAARPQSLVLSLVPADVVPGGFALDRAYPDPFNPSTVIRYRLPVESRVELNVYDVLGQQIASLADDVRAAGEGSVVWNALGVAGGIYFVELHAVPTADPASPFTSVIKVVLQK